MIDWILILTYLVTYSHVTESPNCVALPNGYPGVECVHGASPEEILPPERAQIVLNVYDNKADCVLQAVRFADGVDKLPRDIVLRISDSVAETYTCRGEVQK